MIKEIPSLSDIKLIGTSLGDYLDDFALSLTHRNIKALDLQLNGLTEQVLKASFKHIVNFETLREIDLSSSWFVVDGLYGVKDQFLRFKSLKVLRLGVNKLCLCH